MQCPKCKNDNPSEALFCMKCGTKLERKCPNCGSEYPEDAIFCMKCGAKIAKSDATAIPKLEDMQRLLQDRIPQSLADRLFAGAKQMQGEYRLVTAIFADVSGSSTMARNMPLEKYVDIMDECFKMMVDVISIKYEGSINRFIGDCVLAFFGAPITHENDADRAILAALDIRDAVKELDLSVSIGINTGNTYFGEMGSDLTYSERSAWGPDVDFAKRLQESAQPGQIYVGASTYRLTRRAFDFDNPADIEIKGSGKPQTAYPVIHVKVHPEKLRGIEGLRSRMIGREREFTDLKDSIDELISGKGQIAIVIGEAGLGKSRLATELKSYLKDKDAQYYEGRCVSIGQAISYWPFLDILRSYLNLSDKDTETDVARKLREAITELFPQRYEDILPFLGNLMSIKLGDDMDNKVKYYNPEQIRHQTLMSLRNVFIAISNRNPLLLILEDLHWADDLSIELISLLMDELSTNPMMMLCIYRPEREHKCWKIADTATRKCIDRYTDITLKQLSKTQSRQLVESLLEIDNLPETTKDMVLSKSEGNPFFIEEVIRFLIDSDLIYHEGEKWKAKKEIVDIYVPDTIQSVLLSRVDRLQAETKYVLQCASVVGRLFRYRLLDHLLQHEKDLEERLSQLEDRDLIYEERTIPEIEYTFKHALTQEATYQGILERKRQDFHRQIADGIEDLYRDRLEDFYEELAHHHKLGGNSEKAIDYLLKAGIKLASQYASQSALQYLNQAKDLLDKSELEHREQKALLYEKRGEVLQFIGQWTKAIKDYEEALKWCDDPHSKAEIYRKMGWLECEEMQDKVRAREHLELGLNELPANDRSIEKVRLEHTISWAYAEKHSAFEENINRCQQAVKIAEEFGYMSELAILYSYIAKFHYELHNDPGEYVSKAIDKAEESGDPSTIAWINLVMGTIYLWKGDAIKYYQRAAEISERIGYRQIQAHAYTALAMAMSHGNIDQDKSIIENYERALSIAVETRSLIPILSSETLIDVYAKQNRDDLVISAFSKIMTLLASLDIDEESQGWAIIMSNFRNIYRIYHSFHDSFQYMGKGSEFAQIAHKVLNDILNKVKSRPQKAWYHNQLMKLELEFGNIGLAEIHAGKVISIIDEMNRPDYLTRLYQAHLVLHDYKTSNELAYRFLEQSFDLDFVFYRRIGEIELTYNEFNRSEDFAGISERLLREHGPELESLGVSQLGIKAVGSLESFTEPEFTDKFDSITPSPSWEWIDPNNNSSYIICNNQIEIESQSRGLDNVPRLSMQIAGDFAIETQMGKDKIGGLYILNNNNNNYTTFHRNIFWSDEFTSECFEFVNSKVVVNQNFFNAESPILKLEKEGSIFRAYCSSDGQNWYSCGWTDVDIEASLQVGIFASCPGNKEKAVTSFDYFKIYKPK